MNGEQFATITQEEITAFREEIENELASLLEWWMTKMVDDQHGGFYGRIDGSNTLYPEANKGVILNTRLLWTFSAAASYTKRNSYRELADRAFRYLQDYFWDKTYGGCYWMTDYQGTPVQHEKQVYAQAFATYAFAEYYSLTGNSSALTYATACFGLIEQHSRDFEKGGYLNVFSRNWEPLADQRLSEKDEDLAKIMNTHLHIMEAYANLYRVAPSPTVGKALHYCIELLSERFCARNPRHLYLFFDEDWNPSSEERSFGHDIECAWLLVEAAEILGDEPLLMKCQKLALELAESTLSRGKDPAGGIYENTDQSGLIPEAEKHWWPQAEAIVGFLQAYQLTNDDKWWHEALSSWLFIKDHFRDNQFGEWHWMIDQQGQPIVDREDKAGPWKAPYHNVRMCLETLTRTT